MPAARYSEEFKAQVVREVIEKERERKFRPRES